jgi:hypothetical protein
MQQIDVAGDDGTCGPGMFLGRVEVPVAIAADRLHDRTAVPRHPLPAFGKNMEIYEEALELLHA